VFFGSATLCGLGSPVVIAIALAVVDEHAFGAVIKFGCKAIAFFSFSNKAIAFSSHSTQLELIANPSQSNMIGFHDNGQKRSPA
jgi:hypothetical protein